MVLNLSKREDTAAAVAATTIEVMMTIVEWPSEKNVPTVTGFCPVASRRRVIRSMAYALLAEDFFWAYYAY
jgi:hypothetical protein